MVSVWRLTFYGGKIQTHVPPVPSIEHYNTEQHSLNTGAVFGETFPCACHMVLWGSFRHVRYYC